MRIILTVHHPLIRDAGAPGTTLELAEAYTELGHDVTVLSHDDMPMRLGPRARELLFPVFLAQHLRAVCRRDAVDVIDGSTGDLWLFARVRSGSAVRPLLVTRSHGLEHLADAQRRRDAAEGHLNLSWKYPLYWGGIRLWEVGASLRSADLCLFLNQPDRDHAVDRLRVAPERAHIVANGIAPAFLARANGRPAEGSPKIVQLGSYIPRKGTAYGAQALIGVMRRHRGISVSFLGTGCDPAVVLGDFPQDLHDRIHVAPRYRRQDLPVMLDEFQIKLFPSTSEGFGKTVLEAMARGLAPIIARIPGPTEFVRDGENGLVVAPRNARELEKALDRMIADRPFLKRLRTEARRTAEFFSWDRCARERLCLYANGIDQRRHGG
jgi:glycosyltransferase involved in cell wall biosynthesis